MERSWSSTAKICSFFFSETSTNVLLIEQQIARPDILAAGPNLHFCPSHRGRGGFPADRRWGGRHGGCSGGVRGACVSSGPVVSSSLRVLLPVVEGWPPTCITMEGPKWSGLGRGPWRREVRAARRTKGRSRRAAQLVRACLAAS